jgi:hypothetical protein
MWHGGHDCLMHLVEPADEGRQVISREFENVGICPSRSEGGPETTELLEKFGLGNAQEQGGFRDQLLCLSVRVALPCGFRIRFWYAATSGAHKSHGESFRTSRTPVRNTLKYHRDLLQIA